MDDTYIATQLTKFSISDSAIARLNEDFNQLNIVNVEDIEGYKRVRAARIEIKGYRVEVEKKRKELNEDALKFQRAINSEAKRITALLEPIESTLEAKEKAHEAEKERIKKEEEEKQKRIFQERVKKLTELEFTYKFEIDSFVSAYHMSVFASHHLKIMSDNDFNEYIILLEIDHKKLLEERAQEAKRQQEAKEREETDRRAESERLEQQKREIEEERKRLADIAQEQREREETLKAEELRSKQESERIKEEKRKLEEERQEKIRKNESEIQRAKEAFNSVNHSSGKVPLTNMNFIDEDVESEKFLMGKVDKKCDDSESLNIGKGTCRAEIEEDIPYGGNLPTQEKYEPNTIDERRAYFHGLNFALIAIENEPAGIYFARNVMERITEELRKTNMVLRKTNMVLL